MRDELAAGLVALALATSTESHAPTQLPPARPPAAGQEAREPKALMVFVDGFLPGAIAVTDTPALDRLMEHAAWSLSARAESTTISGSGWSSFLNGVHWDLHGVHDNAFETPRFDRYPHVFARLKEARPGAVCASAQSWQPIEDLLVVPSRPDHHAFHDYYAYSDDYWDEASADRLCKDEMLRFLAEPELDLAVVMFGELDGVGHSEGNRHYTAESELYRRMLSRIDGYVGELLDAIEARPTYGGEDWLVVVSTDHAGAAGQGHGRNTPEHRTIPFIVSGPSAHPGEIWPPPKTPDVAATVLAHLGVELDPAWGLDGRPVGLAPSARPLARLGANLVFNGGAELERGLEGYTRRRDASVAGWDDPGWVTAVRYGAPGGFPGEGDALPDAHGESFFAGGYGKGDGAIRQTIDLAPLAPALSSGAAYELSGWLGGRSEAPDSCKVRARFVAEDGRNLHVAVLEPVTPEERGGRSGFVHRVERGAVPPAARRVVVEVLAGRASGAHDGFADEIALRIWAR